MSASEKLLDNQGLQSIPIEKEPQLYQLSVEQYIQMIEMGLFHPELKTELIEGRLYRKGGIPERHAYCVNRLVSLLFRELTNDEFDISVQNPIRLQNSRPEPDLVIQTKASWEAGGDPKAEDISLVIEVAHSSLTFDREIKLPIYAKNGIKNYWIVNLESNQLEVYGLPSDGTYNEKKVYKPGEKTSLPGMDKEIAVSDFLS
ncbi:MAG: Uma2 family endonuclease [Cyclobacteriaceae bacterium]